jgi:hypothetical protein
VSEADLRVAASQPNIHGTKLTTAVAALLAERDRYEAALRRIAEGDLGTAPHGEYVRPLTAREVARAALDPTGGTE